MVKDTVRTSTIEQTVIFRSGAHDVYEAIMDSKKHARFTGGTARVSRRVGGKFSIFDGYATGVNIELVPDRKIVQSWRADDWPDGHYSKVTFEFVESDGKTKLVFTQVGVPVKAYEDISQGWRDYYWKPMKKLLEG